MTPASIRPGSGEIDRPDMPPVTPHRLREFVPDMVALTALGVLTAVSAYFASPWASYEPYVLFVWSQAVEQLGGGGLALVSWCAFALGIGRAVALGRISRLWWLALPWAAMFIAFHACLVAVYIEDRYAFAAWPS